MSSERDQWLSIYREAYRSEQGQDCAALATSERESVLAEKKKAWSIILCENALNATSLALAEKMIKRWFDCNDCGCEQVLGVQRERAN